MVIAGIVAGGVGSRMGNSKKPKQFIEIGGKPIVIHTIEKFLSCEGITGIVIGVHREWLQFMEDLMEKFDIDQERTVVVTGGDNRNETIYNIIEKSKEIWAVTLDTIFVTHDAVRPFVSFKIIQDNIIAAQKYGVCDTVYPASDTVVQSTNHEFITDIPRRDEMYQGQTPQSFKYELFKMVYESMTDEELNIITDACKMFYLRKQPVYLVMGDVSNFKITYPFDLNVAKVMLGG